MRPGLLSVITPTWNRPTELGEMLANLDAQDYPNVEHIVVSDGQDARVLSARSLGRLAATGRRQVIELGRNFTTEGPPNSFGIGAITAGLLLAQGDYLCWWCDDERALVPDHLSRLVNLLESTGADFVYPLVRIWRNGDPDGPESAIIGTDPPQYCQLTHMVFRASCLRRFGMPRWGSHPVDWSLARDWMAAGATWAFLPELTFEHRLDQI